MSTRVSQTVKWVTCGYTRTNCCSSSWTGELPSFGSYFVVCLCFCLLCKFSFNTRSMKSGSMDLVRQSEIMDNRKLWRRRNPFQTASSVLHGSPSLDRQATNCHEWRSVQCQAAVLNASPNFGRQMISKTSTICESEWYAYPRIRFPGLSAPNLNSAIILLSLLPVSRP